MKIAVLGGTFNPIHMAHLAVADEVCTSLGYDRVLFVPSNIPPHKQMNCSVTTEDRVRMVQRACDADPRFQCEPCEVERGGISYTYDTICFLEKKYAHVLEGKLGLIMGRDQAAGFHLWHRAHDIARMVDLVLVERPVMTEPASCSVGNVPTGNYASITGDSLREFNASDDPLLKGARVLSNALLPVSSTDIRERASEGRAFRYLVPPAVFEYIMGGNLYGQH